MVDIGGGFPGSNLGVGMPSFQDIASTIRLAILDFIKKLNDNERQLRFIAEPGRYFVSSSTTIATKIYSRKGGKENKTQSLFIDDGCYGSFNNIIYDHYHAIPITLKQAINPTE